MLQTCKCEENFVKSLMNGNCNIVYSGFWLLNEKHWNEAEWMIVSVVVTKNFEHKVGNCGLSDQQMSLSTGKINETSTEE